jgi:hypothetical protein
MRPLAFALALAFAQSASAADITDVADAGQKGNPIDIDLSAFLSFLAESASITREAPAPGEPEIPTAEDTIYSRRRASLDLAAEIGIARDFALFGVLPLVLSDTRGLDRADGVAQSTLEAEGLLGAALPNEVSRKGVGDATLGFKLGLMNQERDPTKPSWVARLSARLPTGAAMVAGNTGVGEGLLGLSAELDFSKRFGRLDPFAALSYTYYAENGQGTIFRDVGRGQRSVRPGQRGEVKAGVELIAWDGGPGKKVAFRVDGAVGFVSLGRGYTPLFDFLAEVDADQSAALTGVDAGGDPSAAAPFDGLLEEEQHGFGRLSAGLSARIEKLFEFRLIAGYERVGDHFLSFGSAGVDNNGNGIVDNEDEQNPFFVPAIDTPGARTRAEGQAALTAALNLALRF